MQILQIYSVLPFCILKCFIYYKAIILLFQNMYFFNVGPPNGGHPLTTFYGLYFNRQIGKKVNKEVEASLFCEILTVL